MEERLKIDCDNLPFLALFDGQELTLEKIETESVDLTLVQPMKLPFGNIESRPSGWVKIEGCVAGVYVSGQGEGATLPEPIFTDDSGQTIAKTTSELLREIQNEPISIVEALNAIQSYKFENNGRYPTARLAVEMSIFDIFTKANNISMKDLIGIPSTTSEVPYGFSIGATTKSEIMMQSENAISQHATKIKLKISPDTHNTVTDALKTLRGQHPTIGFMVDANGTYDPLIPQHIINIDELDSLGLLMIEEPVSRVGDLRDLAAVRELRSELSQMKTDVCLDDCLKSSKDCTDSLEDELAQIINIKPGRIGSFATSLLLVDWVCEQGGQVMVGGMLEATPGRAMTTLLGAYCLQKGFTIPGDLSLAQERLSTDLVLPSRQMGMSKDGNIILPTGKGWGY